MAALSRRTPKQDGRSGPPAQRESLSVRDMPGLDEFEIFFRKRPLHFTHFEANLPALATSLSSGAAPPALAESGPLRTATRANAARSRILLPLPATGAALERYLSMKIRTAALAPAFAAGTIASACSSSSPPAPTGTSAAGVVGTCCEGCIVSEYPSDATEDARQANIVAAGYSK